MPKLLTTSPPGSAEWKAARRGKITASTAASILVGAEDDVKTYGTPYSEWLRITEELRGNDPPEEERDEFMQDALAWGNDSEELHLHLLSKKASLMLMGSPGTFEHDTLPYLVATPDGMAKAFDWPAGYADGWPITVELKAPTEFGMAKWSGDSPPLFYQIQGAVQCMVMGTDTMLISALIPPAPKWSTTSLDPVVRDDILERLDTFWHKNVLADIPPELVGKDLELVENRYRPRAGLIVPGTAEHLEWIAQWNLAKDRKAQYEDEEKALKARLIASMQHGDTFAEGLRLPDGSGLTYKEQRRVTPPCLEEKVSVFRVLRAVKRV